MENILLTILPYWSPIIPPVGMATLKGFLQPHGYRVKTVDVMAKRESLEFYYGYFDILKKYIEPEKRGNFYNVGHDLLQHHMTAHLHYKKEADYLRLVERLIHNYYDVRVDRECILELKAVTDDFYNRLQRYFVYLLESEAPDVLGITVYKATLAPSLFVLKLARERFPHIKTVIGGGIFADSHEMGSPNFDTLLKATTDYLDKIVIGPGEWLFLQFLRGQLPDSQRVYTVADIEPRQPDSAVDVVPDYSDFNTYKYPYIAATASVGCMYRCTFCNEAEYWGKFRKKDPRRVVEEMTGLYQKYNRQLFFMTDSMLNPVVTDLSRTVADRGVPFYYDAFFRIDNAARDIANTMQWRRGGLYRVRLGIESGSQRMLDMMGKGITVEQIRDALSALALAGIKTTTYWIIGHPGETEDDFQQTLQLVEQLKDFIWQAECNPFRYSYSGQNRSDQWAAYRVPLFSMEMQEMTLFQEWTLNLEPGREVTFDRIHRFVAHCRELGIPNPYSTMESNEADQRWKTLHPRAVPALLDFVGEKSFVDENRENKEVTLAVNHGRGTADFSF